MLAFNFLLISLTRELSSCTGKQRGFLCNNLAPSTDQLCRLWAASTVIRHFESCIASARDRRFERQAERAAGSANQRDAASVVGDEVIPRSDSTESETAEGHQEGAHVGHRHGL